MNEVYLGTIILWSISWAPADWAFCNGQLLQISPNQALFSLLSNTYGGDGITTFALPDLRSRVPLGAYQPSNGAATALTPQDFAATGGSEVTVLPTHTHTASGTGTASGTFSVSSQPANLTTATAGSSIAAPGTNAGSRSIQFGTATLGFNTTAPDTQIAGLNMSSAITGIQIAPAGVSPSGGNLQPFLALNYIICVSGLYPVRP